MTEQKCDKCSSLLPIIMFEWAKNRPNPRKTCNKCRNKDRPELTTSQKEHRKQWKAEYIASGKAQITWERCIYGIAKVDLDYSHCLICGGTNRLCIDHDHTTGLFRGLLCTTCNAGLGMFKDNIGLLEKAINYLDQKEKK